MFDFVLRGIFAGFASGLITGILTIISDGIFYSKYATSNLMAREYSKPVVQLMVFLLISILYGSIQGGIFTWLIPLLPSDWVFRGVIFGVVSYIILSRHFVEGLAFMNTKFIPVNLSIYLSVEFFLSYLLQGIIISWLLKKGIKVILR